MAHGLSVPIQTSMRTDIERWNQKYREKNPHPTFEPDAILSRYQYLLDGRGTALDVASGVGHNAMHLAKLGYDVLAVDGSIVGLRHAKEALKGSGLNVQLVVMDLDNFAPPAHAFDVVLIVRFLDRALISRLKRALRSGGTLICETFNRNVLRERPAFNEHFLLELGELAGMFEDLDPVSTNDSADLKDSLTHWVGRKP